MADIQLWEILVPTISSAGRPLHLRFHRVWDSKVRAVAGGLTIFKPAKGQWMSPIGQLYAERMIPVRVACTEEQMEVIANMTMEYYDQLAVMYYRISNKVVIKRRDEDEPV